MRIVSRLLTIVLCTAYAVLIPAHLVQASELPTRLSVATNEQEIPIVSSLVTPSQWFIPSNGLAVVPRDRSGSEGYIFYGYNWQSASTKLSRTTIGQELTLYFPSSRPKTFIVYNLFSVSPKGDDHSSLAEQSDTLLIYTSDSYADRDQLVILAKEKQTTEVSSL